MKLALRTPLATPLDLGRPTGAISSYTFWILLSLSLASRLRRKNIEKEATR